MDPFGELIIGFAILVGLAGILLPVLPGLLLVVGAVVVWAFVEGGAWAWAVAGVAILLAVVGTVIKYLIPGRRLAAAGIPKGTMLLGGALAIIGFFVIPVIGAPVGFVLGVYLAERQRLGDERAWASTKQSVGAVAWSIGIELTAGLLITGAWLIAVIWLT